MEYDERFPNAIVHFDGDSFFASIEQVMNYKLRGKPVITGGERGAATSLSIEAKRLGLSRGMTMRQIREICPEAKIVGSDYTTYSVYARRMYEIARRFTPHVEEYSIDECFADITDARERFNASYEEIALMIKHELERCLGVTFGVGLAPSKVLAKAASKHRKPAGFTSIPLQEIQSFLKDVPIGKVWGIGSSMSVYLGNRGIRSAFDFASKDRDWIMENGLSKPYRQMWYELQGHCIHHVSSAHSGDIGSIIKSRTFSPPSKSRSFIFSQLSKNIERACAVARRAHVRASAITFYLKTQEFTYHSFELSLPVATANPTDILLHVVKYFDEVYVPNILYRATGVTLRGIKREHDFTPDLFGVSKKVEGHARIFKSLDTLNRRYGRETVYLGSSMRAFTYREKRSKKSEVRPSELRLDIDNRKKVIDLPFLGITR